MSDSDTSDSFLKQIKHLLKDDSIEITETLQSLWSGYGAIVRIRSKASNHSYIVKVIDTRDNKAAHPRGWNTSTSHQRKIKSYIVESNFYTHYANLTDERCKTPRFYKEETTGSEQQVLVMEDLDDSGYFVRKQDGDWHIATMVISWLSNFHAKFMFNDADKLWEQGGYWHLATRQDELNNMPDSKLKELAPQIDARLSNAKYQTLVHGDAKLENMCFHHNGVHVAAVDFQYIGKGSGVIDLAYFMGSAFKQTQLFEYHEKALNFYLDELKKALMHYNKSYDWDELENEYRNLYQFAWADFHRFLIGWNPDSWKMNEYIARQSSMVVEQLTHC